LFVLIVILPCFAQVSDVERTNGAANGRFWANLSSTSKLYFILGFEEAMGLASPDSEALYLAKSPIYGDVVKGLDRFYQEPENLMIPISDGLIIFQIKANGATQAEVETKMAVIRRRIKLTEELLKKKQ
jgi:hypothetical protein